MKKLKFAPLLLFLLACNNNHTETNNLATDTTITDYSADSTKKWTRNLDTSGGEIVNLTDGNGLKQGKWIVDENGKQKEEWYKDGKLVDKPNLNQ